MEFLYEIILVPIILLILPFIAIPYFNEMSEKAKDHAERAKNLSKTELKQDQKKNNDNSP